MSYESGRSTIHEQFTTILDETAVERYRLAAGIASTVLGNPDYALVKISRQRRPDGAELPEGKVRLTIEGDWVTMTEQLSSFWRVKEGLDAVAAPQIPDSTYQARHAASQEA